MTIYENLTTFAGKPVRDFKAAGDVTDFAATAPRLRCTYDEDSTLRDYIAVLLDQPGVDKLEALVLGLWMENGEAVDVTPQPALEMLVSMKNKLPNLKALFVGDIISEENEISWIGQTDQSAVWGAFPNLEDFGVRGGNNLRLGRINHGKLKKLVVEAGGLPSIVVREALEANAPLEHLELWMGAEDYGANTSVDDFRELFSGRLFPQLKTLALRNCGYTDALAEALVQSPIIDRIDTLDLSLGTLTDIGAKALIDSGKVEKLKHLDATHHFMSPEMADKLRKAGPSVVADDPQEPDTWGDEVHYHVAVSE